MTDDLPLWAITHSRLHGEPTSYEAAKGIAMYAKVQWEQMVGCLQKHGPLTCDEMDERIGWRPTTAGRRIADAVRYGRIEFTGQTRPTRSGRRANVYRAVANRKEEAA